MRDMSIFVYSKIQGYIFKILWSWKGGILLLGEKLKMKMRGKKQRQDVDKTS